EYAQSRKQERDTGKSTEQPGLKTPLNLLLLDNQFHTTHGIYHCILVHAANHCTCSGGKRCRISRCADHDVINLLARGLRLRLVNLGQGCTFQTAASYISHNTDDRKPVIVLAAWIEALHVFADRIFARPVALRERLADNDDQRRVRAIAFAKEPTANQRDSHGTEVIARNLRPHQRFPGGSWLRRMAFDSTKCVSAPLIQIEQVTRTANRLRTRKARNTLHDFPINAGIITMVELNGKQIRRLKAEIHMKNRKEAMNQQAGSGEQNHSNREFSGYQQIFQSPAAPRFRQRASP